MKLTIIALIRALISSSASEPLAQETRIGAFEPSEPSDSELAGIRSLIGGLS